MLGCARYAVWLALAGTMPACHTSFDVKKFPSTDALYQASLREFQQGRWSRAVLGFDKLANELNPRDTLLPRAYYYLGRAHQQAKEYILAASAFARLADVFPDDTLAALGMYEAGYSYERMWKNPQLDAQHGMSALERYRTLQALYPRSSFRPRADSAIARVEDRMAKKEYIAGDYYFRRRGYDSAIMYFKALLEKYPQTPTARRAALRMLEAYRTIKYADDAADLCIQMLERWPQDAEVRGACGRTAVAK